MKGEISYLDMAAWMHRVTEPAISSAIRTLHLPAGSRGLDAGCGIGTHTLWLAEAASPGEHVTGVDISAECLARALPLTYAVEALRAAIAGGDSSRATLDLFVLAVFTAASFGLASRMPARQVA